MIPRIAAIARLGRVPVPHTNEATYALDASGRRWVAKREADMGCEALLAEAVTWLLARRLGVPMPDAAFCDAEEERAWLSAWVPHAKHWSVGTTGEVRNVTSAAGILVLDAVVCNEARHGGNLLLVADESGGSEVIAIDSDEALIGHPTELARRGLVAPDPRILAHGFPPPGWRDRALVVAERCECIAPDVLVLDASVACELAREPAVQLLTAVFTERCANARRLTADYLDLVEARR